MAKCQKPGPALHAELRTEVTAKFNQLKTKCRLVEDARTEAIDATAAADEAELALEDLLRDIDGDLGKLDREDPSMNARATVFPNGFGAAIDPEGDEQLEALTKLRVRLAVFSSNPIVASALAKLDAAENALRGALKVEEAAEKKVDGLFAEELEARREIREQLESAFGRLRDLYKARPAVVERFFLREIGGRKRAEAPGKSPPAAGEQRAEAPGKSPPAAGGQHA
jgi:hypothetical protein